MTGGERLNPTATPGPARTPEPSLHRKNAAEWVMYAALYPAYVVLRVFSFVSSRLRG